MSRPWMPLYVGDYLRDTAHLTTVQHGAYLLLIMHYWTHGGLPADEGELARICRMTGRQWVSNCLAIASMFQPDWKHKRIEAELEKYRALSEKRAMSGRKGGVVSRSRNNVERFSSQAIAKQTGTQPHKKDIRGQPKAEASSELAATIRARGWVKPDPADPATARAAE